MTKQHIIQFNRHANAYGDLNIIQKEVAKELTSSFATNGQIILDIGCGSGEVFKNCHFPAKFIGIDNANNMLLAHPKNDNIELICADFDIFDFTQFKDSYFDIAFSSSSLQWSGDIKAVLSEIVRISKKCAVSIFADGTFKTIREISGAKTFLKDAIFLEESLKSLGFKNVYSKSYRLPFDKSSDAFGYIKKCGLSGGVKRLGYQDIKRLIDSYTLGYLEFEVTFGFKD